MADDRTSEPDDMPSGMPDEGAESDPLGVPEARPESEGEQRGADAMPGIPTDGEPPDAG
jgi:hypothetical protein